MNTYIRSLLLILTLGITLPAASVFAEEKVYGWQLMSVQERNEYRTKMQNMNTAEERKRFQMQHHEQMEKRAQLQRKSLPEKPQNRSNMMDVRGMGSGSSTGGGGGRR